MAEYALLSSVSGPTPTSLALMDRLGLALDDAEQGTVAYQPDYQPPTLAVERLICIPHGRTPSNQKLLFQSHDEGPNAALLPESFDDAAAGAAKFFETFGERLTRRPSDFVFLRSPLLRTAQTAGVYAEIAKTTLGVASLAVAVAPGCVEIDHASWHGKSVAELEGDDARAAARYREGSFFAAPPPPGESNLEMLARCEAFLGELSERFPGKVVVCFGHGTFQNGLETLLQSLPGTPSPAAVFTRKPGASHLRRGFPHDVFIAAGAGASSPEVGSARESAV